MSLWSKNLKRSQTGEIRKEDEALEREIYNSIDEFLSNQKEKISYEIIDLNNPIVNIDGNLHLNQSDLEDGKLFFKIGKLTGDLYFYGKSMSPSVVPDEMGGYIIFVPDEEELYSRRTNKGNSEVDGLQMGYLSRTPKSQDKVNKKLEEVLTEIISQGYDLDIEKIKKKLEEEWNNKNSYALTMEATPHMSRSKTPKVTDNYDVEFYINDPSGKKLINLTAIEKAVYILFILNEEGRLLSVTDSFKDTLKKIYLQIHGRVQDDENGLIGGNFSEKALLSCRHEIRDAIKEHISNSKIVDEFAIEGYKAEKFKVQKATKSLREQIKTTFGI